MAVAGHADEVLLTETSEGYIFRMEEAGERIMVTISWEALLALGAPEDPERRRQFVKRRVPAFQMIARAPEFRADRRRGRLRLSRRHMLSLADSYQIEKARRRLPRASAFWWNGVRRSGVAGDPTRQRRLRRRADLHVGHFAILEQHECRD